MLTVATLGLNNRTVARPAYRTQYQKAIDAKGVRIAVSLRSSALSSWTAGYGTRIPGAPPNQRDLRGDRRSFLPGYAIHTPADIGIDSFHADRSPTHGYRTAPLAGLWSHQEGGFFHDGRFATLDDVVNHYDAFLGLKLADTEKRDLVQFLLSI